MKDFKINIRYTDTSENLSRYFSEVSKHKILSPDEEAELAFKAKEGDPIAKDKIIKSNLRFVITVAKSYASKNSPLEDLISEGNKGLVEAIEIFDPTTGFKFISYAVWHIRKNIFVYLNNHSRMVRLPQNVLSEMKKVEKVQDYFVRNYGREGNYKEIIELMEENGMGIPSDRILDIIENKPVTIALDSGNSSENEALSPIDWLKSEDDIDVTIFRTDEKEIVDQILPYLNDIDRKIVKMKYGLDDKGERSYSEIGMYFERSSEWVRLSLRKAIKRMMVIARRKKIELPFR
jgi:RNA polymerase primary sigma factor